MFDGFVTVNDGAIVDSTGHQVLLRGVGLGNWLLPEGYMWRLSPGRESPREIEALITELVGATRARRFWDEYLDQFITRGDIQQIAAAGFNHVRLPINWRHVIDPDGTMRPQGLALIDRLIDWCTEQRLWVLLDLHGAPGGQTGTNIDDSNGRPELFMDPANMDLTVALWRELASRYRDNTTVLGYDLLNEPLPNEWQHTYPSELVDLYQRITEAIREVDPNHLLMYEGTHWASNWDIFTDVWDPNSVLQFHRYWAPPDLPSIQHFIDVGAELGLPIYMGEGGENNTDWLATAFQLYEDHHVGWNFWPWKKIDTLTSPCSVVPPPGWSDIIAFGNGETSAPSPKDAWSTLEELINNMAFDKCDYHPEVINALFRRAPLSIPATGFGFRGPGISYSTQSSTPLRGFRHNDSVTILQAGETTDQAPFFGHDDGRTRLADEKLTVLLQPGEWVTFDIEIPHPGNWTVVVVTDPDTTAPPIIGFDGTPLTVGDLGNGEWQAITDPDTAAGRHTIRIEASTGNLQLDRVNVRGDPS
ncbi:MAG: cellulase family glycosylhydrolase [Actinobacteria bacterium]|nr:cellulase family glycosylhydrolase [Actinomycetota bacterium]